MVPTVKRVSDSRTTGLRPKAPEIAQNTGWKAAEQRTKDVWEMSETLHRTMIVICVVFNDGTA